MLTIIQPDASTISGTSRTVGSQKGQLSGYTSEPAEQTYQFDAVDNATPLLLTDCGNTSDGKTQPIGP